MEHKTFGLIAAMAAEIKPLLNITGKCSKTKLEGFNLYSFSIAGKQCRLIESGIGMERAARAVKTLISGFSPSILISFGFGGAVRPGMNAGDLAVAGRNFLARESATDPRETVEITIPPGLLPVLANTGRKYGFSVRQCDLLTSDKILNKKNLTAYLPRDTANPVLDMETWAIARVAMPAKIPLLAIRAISDTADDEIDFGLDRITDREMNIRISRVLLTIASTPPHIAATDSSGREYPDCRQESRIRAGGSFADGIGPAI